MPTQVFQFLITPNNARRVAKGRMYFASVETGLANHEYFAQPVFITKMPRETGFTVQCVPNQNAKAAGIRLVFDEPVPRGKYFEVAIRLLAVPGPAVSPIRITPG